MKKVLIGCGIVAGLLVLGLIGLTIVGMIAMHNVKKMGQMPPQLKTPAVLQGQNLLTKSTYCTCPTSGTITDIIVGDLDPQPGFEMRVAGTTGSELINSKGQELSSLSFHETCGHVTIVDIENDGVCEYLNRGNWTVDASLLDHQGNPRWNCNSSSGTDDACAGDIDNDGKLEFAIGMNGGGGVHLLETDGHEVWSKAGANIWHVEMLDTNHDGRLELIHSDAGGQMTVMDQTGNILTSAKLPSYFSHFSLCKWTCKSPDTCIVYSSNDCIYLVSGSGNVICKLAAPYNSDSDAFATSVKLTKGKPAYFAVLSNFILFQRSILYVYDPTGKLIYQEVMPMQGQALAAGPTDTPGKEALYVGGQGEILRYVAQ